MTLTAIPLLLFSLNPPPDLDSLQHEGFAISVIQNLIPAQQWRRSPLPRAIIIDCPEDERSMAEICDAVRHASRVQHMPLLAVTANDPAARQTALDAGADVLLTAPLELVELEYSLKRILGIYASPQLSFMGDIDALGHDLKSSLGTVISGIDLMREMLQENELLHTVAVDSLQAALRQNILIENMIDYMRMRDGMPYVDKQTMPLDEIMRVLHDEVARVTVRRNGNLFFEFPEESVRVLVDRSLIIRIIIALVDNAMKFCTQDNEIIVCTEESEDSVYIQVKDTGRAIL
ncbi:MAG TPA: hypothetical protein VJZ27_16640, partial [Aggregatilineales bacterium]|nr:hypothetical protein [Aggregatilineales bacterium]